MRRNVFLLAMLITFLYFQQASAQNPTDSINVDSVIRSLPEVMVKGERPLAVVHGSAITYDLPRIIEKKGVDNVFDAIKELPGVTEKNGEYQLANRSVTIALNGKVMSLTPEQMAQLLKSVPADRLEKADVMYAAPAKSQVRGALINLRLKDGTQSEVPLQGELNAAYNQKHHAMFGERAAVLYHKGKLTLDAMYLHSHGSAFQVTDEKSRHKLNDGSIYEIENHQEQLVKQFGHDYRVSAEYDFAKEHRLSLAYQANYNHRDTYSDYMGNIIGRTFSTRRIWLHNIRLDYQTPFGLKAGFETTYYHDPEQQDLQSVTPAGNFNFFADNDQRVNVWRYYLSEEHQLRNNWNLNYGVWYKQSLNHSLQSYRNQAGVGYLRQREDIINVYMGLGKSWNNKFILDASLAAEYYHSPQWHQWNIYPTLNMTYVHTPSNIWVMGFSTNRTYPEYWAMNNFTVYSNGGYDEITGNPYLKPAKSYQTNLVWILKNKYHFVAGFNYVDDYFIQTPYQRSDRLAKTFKYVNLHYQQQAFMQAVIPHRFGSWLDARLTLTGVWMHEKCNDFYDIPFDRAILFGMAQMSNVITLSTKPDLSLTVDGMLRSRAHQAIYDLPGSGNIDIGLRWQFWKKQAVLHVFCNDLLETSSINPRIDFKGQYVNMHFGCYRELGVSLTVKFGGYKAKKNDAINMLRFRK